MTRAVSRRDFMRVLGAGLAVAALPELAFAEGPDRPNILFIGADDLRCELNCYGRTHIHSPNIDRLARGGVLFQRAYVQQAVCAASRASFLTGCRPDTTGVDYPYNDKFRNEFLKTHPAIHTFFHRHGYYTRTLGKIHHGWVDDMGKLSEKHFSNGGARTYALPEHNRQGRKPAVEMADVPDNAYADGRIADEVVATLRRAAQRQEPFCLNVGFYKPHLPFTAPKRYWDLYERDRIELSPNPYLPPGAPAYAAASYELPHYEEGMLKDGAPMSRQNALLLRHAYYACVSFVDAQIGKILDELERLGLRENTVIMLWGDHGWHLGDNGCWGKHTNFERATHAPLIVDAPGIAQGRTSDALVEYVDMFPTLCELAGLPVPTYMEGASLVPLLHEPDRAWKSAAFSQYPRGTSLEGYAIRTDRYRYVEWRRRTDQGYVVEARELYDHKVDPLESVSIAAEPQNRALVARLAAKLQAGWRQALPPGIAPYGTPAQAPS